MQLSHLPLAVLFQLAKELPEVVPHGIQLSELLSRRKIAAVELVLFLHQRFDFQLKRLVGREFLQALLVKIPLCICRPKSAT